MLLVVGNEKGGVGKSMLAANLAARIQQDGHSVVIADTDSTGTASGWCAIRKANQIDPRIDAISAPDHPAPVLLGLASQFDAVIIDVGARDYSKLGTLARIADFWLAPTGVSQGDMDSTLRLYAAIQKFGALHPQGRVPFAVVLMNTPVSWNSSEEDEARDYMKAIAPDVLILEQSVRHRRSWRDAGKSGYSVMELPGRDNAKAVDEFEGAYQEILAKMKPATTEPATEPAAAPAAAAA